jgi:formate dehydrogenase maturation protein FdhE
MAQTQEDVLFLVYCPNCKTTVNAVSWKLLEKAGIVTIDCPQCGGWIKLECGKDGVFLSHG